MNSAEIWNRFSEKLRNFLLKRLSDQNIADDLLQEVFLKIHLKLPQLKNEDRLEYWVFQIAYNQLNDFYRKKNNEFVSSSFIEELTLETNKDSHSPMDCLIPFINHLPEKYKEAILLSEVEGLKQQEVAQKLNLSISGAKSRIQRGRELIKQHFVECCNYHINKEGKLVGEHSHSHESWNCNDDDCLIHSED